MTNWHDVVPALNSLLITLSIYVFLLLNIEIRVRIHNLESRRDGGGKGPVARNQLPEQGGKGPDVRNQSPEEGAGTQGRTPENGEHPDPQPPATGS